GRAMSAVVPPSWRLRGAVAPALRRGVFVALPVGIAVLLDLELDDAVAGGLATAALIAGFLAFDAPARVRARWQLLAAPLIGICAGLGVLSSQSTAPAVLAMALVAGLAGYCVAVSRRLALAGMTFVLALLIAQGLYLPVDEALEAAGLGVAGGLLQAAWAMVAWALVDREAERPRFAETVRGAIVDLRAQLSLRSSSLRHALRFGAALAVGVAIYRLIDLGEHGYWVPLTILFVLRPEHSQTLERIGMRAAGTVVGLVLATALAALLGEDPVATAIVLTIAAACFYALLAIEYALFTIAITAYVVLLTDALGTAPLEAADERAVGTAIGIAVAATTFWIWGETREREQT
ncbi:MAG: FUSC family protein, partial [Solirubrobacterales bacterium]